MRERIAAGDLEWGHKKMKEIRRRDLAMVDNSTFIVAVINTAKPTYGSIEELTLAEKSNKPVFIVIKPSLKHIPLWLLGMFKPSCFYSSLQEVQNHLIRLDTGISPFDKKHWKIFEKKYVSRIK